MNRPVGLFLYTRPIGLLQSRGMAKKRTATREPVPDRLLDTASELFYREGIQSVGIQRVIDEAGIAKASLYAHFPSKDDLVAACLERRGAAWREIAQREILDAPLDARAKILTLFDRVADWVASDDFRGCPFQKAGSELADPAHPARAVVERQRAWLQGLLRGLVEEAGLQPVDGVTGALLLLYEGAAAAALLDKSPQPGQHARWAAEAILNTAARV